MDAMPAAACRLLCGPASPSAPSPPSRSTLWLPTSALPPLLWRLLLALPVLGEATVHPLALHRDCCTVRLKVNMGEVLLLLRGGDAERGAGGDCMPADAPGRTAACTTVQGAGVKEPMRQQHRTLPGTL